MPKYKHGSGTIYQRTKIADGKKQVLKVWWLDYYHDGERVRESSGTTDRAEARRLLQQRIGQIADGRFVGPAADRVMFKELADLVLSDYRVNASRSLDAVERRLRKHILPYFGNKKAQSITTEDVQAFVVSRQEAKASNAEINRELAALKRSYNLAIRAEKIIRKPYVPHLTERNARAGFFEPQHFDLILAKLPEYLRPAITFAYYTGWRLRSEILPLTWDQVDLT